MSFTQATATVDFPTIVPFLKGDGDTTEYIVRSYPVSFLFGGAKEGVMLGPSGKDVVEVLSQCKERSLDLVHWYEAMCGFDTPAHDAMITAATTMKTHLPTKKRGSPTLPLGLSWSPGCLTTTRMATSTQR